MGAHIIVAKEYVHLHSLVVSIYTQPSASAAPHLLNQLALYASTHRDLDSRLLQISPNNLVYIASYIARVLTTRLNKDILGVKKYCECIYTFLAELSCITSLALLSKFPIISECALRQGPLSFPKRAPLRGLTLIFLALLAWHHFSALTQSVNVNWLSMRRRLIRAAVAAAVTTAEVTGPVDRIGQPRVPKRAIRARKVATASAATAFCAVLI